MNDITDTNDLSQEDEKFLDKINEEGGFGGVNIYGPLSRGLGDGADDFKYAMANFPGNIIGRVIGVLNNGILSPLPIIVDPAPQMTQLVTDVCSKKSDLNFNGSCIIDELLQKLNIVSEYIAGENLNSYFISNINNGFYGGIGISVYKSGVHHNQYSDYDLNFTQEEIDLMGKINSGTPLIPLDIWDTSEVEDMIKSLNKDQLEGLGIYESDTFEINVFDDNIYISKNSNSYAGEKGRQSDILISLQEIQTLFEINSK